MRIAALYDIHGNQPALDAVLRDVRSERVDQVVIGGDVLPGPMPRECLDLLYRLEIPVHYLRGNGDREVLATRAGTPNTALPAPAQEAIRWNAGQLTSNDAQRLTHWPADVRLTHPHWGAVLFVHATPRNDTEMFTRRMPEERLRPVFASANASIVICGHTHMQFDRMVGDIRVVNAGSVGMPFQSAGAYWLLLSERVELRRTLYELTAAAALIRRTLYPQAREFAERNVLHPPSEAEMLEVFGRVELK